jgi:hypothetical protein
MMGKLFTGTNKSTSTSDPWKPQGDALKDIFSKAGTAFANKEGTNFYEGDLYAGMDPDTAAALKQMVSYQQGRGQDAANQVQGAGSQLADANGYAGAVRDYSSASRMDPTQSNIASATAYANNPAIDGMIDGASRDVSRNLYENELPTIDRAASGSGNMNSTRAGVAAGVAARGAGDRVADISSSIRGQAYDRGLGLAEQGRSTNLSAMGNAAGLYGQQFGQGMGAIGQGRDMELGNYSAAVDAGRMRQADQQGQNDADYMRWQGQDGREMDLLNKYYGIVGQNNWGGTQTGVQKNTGSIFGQLVGAAATAASFSDRRLKENIVKIDELDDGLGVYEYDYIWGEHATGVMADEVAELRPWALGPIRGGFNTVNYAAL